MNLMVEKAKDNNITCKIEYDNGKTKYLYSKYKPKEIRLDVIEARNYIVLGVGLGYELSKIQEKNPEKIYVIEADNIFYDLISSNDELNKVLLDDKIVFLFGDEYKNYAFEEDSVIVNNKNITEINMEYYYEALECINRNKKYRRSKQKKILMLEHETIQRDWTEALKEMGYNVLIVPRYSDKDNNKNKFNIMKQNPDLVMSVNFYSHIAEACNEINIPYVSWCVDTPQYNIYKKEVFYKNSYLFIYEPSTVEYLKKIGVKNVFYMPVAVNIERLDKIILDDEDRKKYGSDISFIGNLTLSEYSKDYKEKISDQMRIQLENLIELQSENINEFILKEKCNELLVRRIKEETGFNFGNYEYIKNSYVLALLLGREQSFRERIKFIQEIDSKFKGYNIKVYGNDLWNNYINNYAGKAEHFIEMPKIMRLSKINLNITRTFVETGIPMRVFDVLGSKGFLLTNYKEGLEYKFTSGKDFLVYRDLKELLEIAEYYLNHEEEREEIVNTGYETVYKYHTYTARVTEMMDIVKKFV